MGGVERGERNLTIRTSGGHRKAGGTAEGPVEGLMPHTTGAYAGSIGVFVNGRIEKSDLHVPLPKGHGPTFSYDPDELRSELDSGTLKCFCVICGEFYLPTEDQKRNLRKHFEETVANG